MTETGLPVGHDSFGADRPQHTIFVTLDGMRGVAALVVVLWHAKILSGFRPLSGYLAVDLFFVLSGFVIAHSYDHRFERGMTWRQFVWIRLVRLYPLYFAGLSLAAAALLGSVVIGAKTHWNLTTISATYVLSLFYIPTPAEMSSNHALFPLNPPAWSLLFEFIVNIAYAIFFRYLRIRTLILLSFFAAAGLVFTTLRYNSLNTGFFWEVALGGFPRVLFSFTVGVILLRLSKSRNISINLGSFCSILLMLAVLCYGPPAAWRFVYDLAAVLVVFPILTLAGASSHPTHGWNLYEISGLSSYAVYVLHVPLLAIIVAGASKILHVEPVMMQPWGGIAFAVAVLTLSWFAAEYYDAPMRRKLATWLNVTRRSQRIEKRAKKNAV